MTARKSLVAIILASSALFTACSDSAREPAAPELLFNSHTATCPSPAAIEAMIRSLVPAGGNRSSALAKFNQVTRFAGRGDMTTAQQRALDLVDFVLNRYRSGALGQVTDPVLRAALENMLDAILCTAGLPPMFGGALGPDGAAALIYPTTPETTVVTGTLFAGVRVPNGSVSVPTLVTISRLPDSPGPLLTQFDQYPLFYEFHAIPSTTFLKDLLVGTCVASSANPPDLSRLRIAHNIAPFTPGSIEILPLQAAGFLDCTDADLALLPTGSFSRDMARSGVRMLMRAAEVLLPQPAYAAGTGLGGTTRNFSPFGAIDTLGIITPASRLEGHGWFGGQIDFPPSVNVNTPTGRPMVGIPVVFALTPGSGVLGGGGTVLTNASGFAGTTSWTLGFQVVNTATATAIAPPGAGFAGNPVTFSGVGHPRE